MKTWARQFGAVIYIGITALSVALAYSLMTQGVLFASQPLLVALRALGVGYIAAGMALWAGVRRAEAGRGQLMPLFTALAAGALVLLLIAVLFPRGPVSVPFQYAGMGLAGAALLVGLLVAVFDPALPEPAAKVWPADRTVLTKFAAEEDPHGHGNGHAHEEDAPGDDDLTVIEGIGPAIEAALAAGGIATYAQLAAALPDEIRAIVTGQGINVPFDPTTWPQQAHLAETGEWKMLDAFQAGLSAGRTR